VISEPSPNVNLIRSPSFASRRYPLKWRTIVLRIERHNRLNSRVRAVPTHRGRPVLFLPDAKPRLFSQGGPPRVTRWQASGSYSYGPSSSG
jgi:hypothetical protein